MKIIQAKYTIINAPPLLGLASSEKRHSLPKPIENPIAAWINAKREGH